MSEFALFDKALEEYNRQTEPCTEDSCDVCPHTETVNERGVYVCMECGQEISQKISHEKEWRFYGQGDNKHGSDPNRVQMRKIEAKNIFKDVENLGFSESIVNKANQIYIQVTKGGIFRGASRKAMVFACIFHAFKLAEKPQSHETLMKIFSLDKNVALKGLKYVNLNAPKNSKIRTTYITPQHLISETMDLFQATPAQKQEVIDLYEKVRHKTNRLSRPRPQSVSAAIIYHWICQKGKDIELKQFAKKVNLSELTINRIAKDIASILQESQA